MGTCNSSHPLGLCKTPDGELRTKEKLRVKCIVNPPRRRKSLQLDILFQSNKNVLVIPISYTSYTSLSSIEISSRRAAIAYFWFRVLKTMLPLQTSLDDLHDAKMFVGALQS